MRDKIIEADTSQRSKKNYDLVSLIAVFFIVVTAGFMIFQNVRNSDELSQKEVVAIAFAEGIQTMCADDGIHERYSRMCTLAKNYSDKERYLNDELVEDQLSTEIKSITCSNEKSIIEYSDGTKAEIPTRCNTSGE